MERRFSVICYTWLGKCVDGKDNHTRDLFVVKEENGKEQRKAK